MLSSNVQNTNSFISFITGSPANRKYLLIALSGSLLQFILFKALYPFPDFFSDSYSYLYSAYANLDVSIWPIGYSKFLRWFHYLTYSDTALIGFQYFLYELSALYFFFSFLYFFKPARTNQIILFIFLFFNPLFLYLCNYINSDPLFLSLSLFWFTQIIWIICHPKIYQIFVQAVLLFFCFTVRNNAYYYPLIMIIVFILSQQKLRVKITGILLPFALLIPFILYTRQAAQKMTGTPQYSLFTGWQLANNALYIYDKINVDSNNLPTAQCKELDQFSKFFFTHLPPEPIYRAYVKDYVGNLFIRQSQSPLKRYVNKYYKPMGDMEEVVAWGKGSAVFSDYGSWIIKSNPLAYMKYFILLNSKHYALPPLEKLELYNQGKDSVEYLAAHWFHYRTLSIRSFSKDLQGSIFYLYPGSFFVLNLYFIGSLVIFISRKHYKTASLTFNKTILTGTALILVNFGFCVAATIIVFRYQVFPMIVLLALTLLLVEAISKLNGKYENQP